MKFTCDLCGEIFDYKSNLTTHMKSCTGSYIDADRKKCDKCEKIVSKSNFARHKKKCNPDAENEGQAPRSRRAPCEHCGLQYTVQNLARHEGSVEMGGSVLRDRIPFKSRCT